mmetsp:Transcript_23592/g.52404  ORF Transcript_23592/g.52404 Transcript_23592/m.52404 type:complete len:245 (-) Transcript_23592:40-774(-)
MPFFSTSVKGVGVMRGSTRWSTHPASTTIHQWMSLSNRQVRTQPTTPRRRTTFLDLIWSSIRTMYLFDWRRIITRPSSAWHRLQKTDPMHCHGSTELQSVTCSLSNSTCGLWSRNVLAKLLKWLPYLSDFLMNSTNASALSSLIVALARIVRPRWMSEPSVSPWTFKQPTANTALHSSAVRGSVDSASLLASSCRSCRRWLFMESFMSPRTISSTETSSIAARYSRKEGDRLSRSITSKGCVTT